MSRDSLRAHVPRTHAFYRFFAWELILGLFLLNVTHWLDNPFSSHQLIPWTLLIVLAILVIAGVRLLREIGKTDHKRATIGFEKKTALVKIGL